MEFKFKRHTSIHVDLEIGDKVTTDGWGPNLDGKIHTITDIRMTIGTSSGVSVEISGYKDNYIDSDWLIKQ